MDIPQVRGKEAVGYPTQKPLALLKRLIEASSNPGDIVLDPFAGCATACVAAEALGRQWVGIDLSARRGDAGSRRLASEVGLSGAAGERAIERGVVTHRNDIPRRSDLGKLPELPNAQADAVRTSRRRLRRLRDFVPTSATSRSTTFWRNQGAEPTTSTTCRLLCGACNSTKGSRSQEEFIARLRRDGLRE